MCPYLHFLINSVQTNNYKQVCRNWSWPTPYKLLKIKWTCRLSCDFIFVFVSLSFFPSPLFDFLFVSVQILSSTDSHQSESSWECFRVCRGRINSSWKVKKNLWEERNNRTISVASGSACFVLNFHSSCINHQTACCFLYCLIFQDPKLTLA